MKKKILKARVIDTGKFIKIEQLQNGLYKDVESGIVYDRENLRILQRSSIAQFGFHLWRAGLFFFVREFWRYKNFYLIPTVATSFVKGYDRYFDIEIKFLCFGFGVRFVWVTAFSKKK